MMALILNWCPSALASLKLATTSCDNSKTFALKALRCFGVIPLESILVSRGLWRFLPPLACAPCYTTRWAVIVLEILLSALATTTVSASIFSFAAAAPL